MAVTGGMLDAEKASGYIRHYPGHKPLVTRVVDLFSMFG